MLLRARLTPILLLALSSAIAVACGSPAPAPVPAPLPSPVVAAIAQSPEPGGDSEAPVSPTAVSGSGIAITLVDPTGAPIETVVDGNAVRVVARLGRLAASAETMLFALEDSQQPFAHCSVETGSDNCSALIRADGWAWENGARLESRTITAAQGDRIGRATIAVAPKPLILVHGLNSDQNSWINWISPGGFLEGVGLPGYAVDDEQFGTGKMNTGIPSKPLARTNSIAENAQVLADYVVAVRLNTGAERVDLVAHSLGGLISRYYVQNLMPIVTTPGLADVPVANQLFMAGTPNGGTACGRIPAALGLFSPATSQITPEYLAQVFNPTVNNARGVPIFAIAGDAVKSGKIAIRCTETPTDQYVSVASVLQGISVGPDTIDAVHTGLNGGEGTFRRILGSLARSPSDYPIVVSGQTEPVAIHPELIQTTLVKGGTLQVGETVTVTIPIDQARDASFILLAPGSQVSMTVRTVAGALLTEETPRSNPNVTFERVVDATLPLTLGYGVLNPRAGPWQIGLTARETPPGGGTFAVMATVDSDLRLAAEAFPAVTKVGQSVMLRGLLEPFAGVLQAAMRAEIRDERDGSTAELELFDDGLHGDGGATDGVFAGEWQPQRAGDYTAIVAATGLNAAGSPFERLTVISVQVD